MPPALHSFSPASLCPVSSFSVSRRAAAFSKSWESMADSFSRLWVPRTVSLPLTWSSLLCEGSRSSVSGCGQRHYYNSSSTNCAKTSTIAVTIVAGPLNYVGVNPKISCPKPSK
jgi:hypothetical protein